MSILEEIQPQDRIARVLIIILLFVTLTYTCWLAIIWASFRTYEGAPPLLPQYFVNKANQNLMKGQGYYRW